MHEYYVIGLMTDGEKGQYLNVYTRCQGKVQLKNLKLKGISTKDHDTLFHAMRHKYTHWQGFHFQTDNTIAKFQTMFGEWTADVVSSDLKKCENGDISTTTRLKARSTLKTA